MSLNFNKVIIAGRISSMVELKKTPNGISVTSFSVAVNRRASEETDFFDVVAWRGTAEFISKFFTKGSAICVSGSLQKRQWTDKNGAKRYAVEIIADEAHFVESKPKEGFMGTKEEPPIDYSPSNNSSFEDLAGDEELPF